MILGLQSSQLFHQLNKKVETIGDAYLGVTNLENDQEHDHVKNAALFAIEMVNEASKILIDEEQPQLGRINVRVGM